MAHWRNSDFQIANYIAGNAHSVDEAYRQLVQLKEDRVVSLKSAESGYKKQQAKIIRATRIINNQKSDEADVLEAEAEILELQAIEEQQMSCYKAAVHEVEFIDACIEKIQPLRKYSHLEDWQAHQVCQQEEWRYELIERAKEYLLTTGTIPTDHYRTMRNHPDFKELIEPIISEVTMLVRTGKNSLINADTILELTSTPMKKLLSANSNLLQLTSKDLNKL